MSTTNGLPTNPNAPTQTRTAPAPIAPGLPPQHARPRGSTGIDYTEYENAAGDEEIGVNFSEGNNTLKLIIVLVLVIGGLVLGFALLFRSIDGPAQEARASVYKKQADMMREAVEMAREAQQMSRQHMAEMQRAMREAEYGDASHAEAPASTEE